MNSKSNYSGFKRLLKFLTTIISWTAILILIIVALFLAYYTIGNKIAEKNDTKFEPIISLYTIVSPSMTPNINVYDVVVTMKVKSPSDIKVNDVITFISTSSISRGMTITHRVIDIGTDENGVTYTTKGDNNLSADSSPAKYSNVIGKVIFRIPSLGRIQSFLASNGNFLIIIIVPALFIILTDIIKLIKLVSVKNKIEEMDQKEQEFKSKKKVKEELRKEELKKQLNITTDDTEYDVVEEEIPVEDKIESEDLDSQEQEENKIEEEEEIAIIPNENEDINTFEEPVVHEEKAIVKPKLKEEIKKQGKSKKNRDDDIIIEKVKKEVKATPRNNTPKKQNYNNHKKKNNNHKKGGKNKKKR
jgi:signal peptidase